MKRVKKSILIGIEVKINGPPIFLTDPYFSGRAGYKSVGGREGAWAHKKDEKYLGSSSIQVLGPPISFLQGERAGKDRT